MKIYLVASDGRLTNVWMDYGLALDKVCSGEAEQVYADPSNPLTFRGIRLIDRPTSPQPSFHRPSLETSNTAISHDVSLLNAGYFFDEGPRQRECVSAHELVECWPNEHDRNAVVVSAGKVYGASYA
jgi:hypothetical protein